MSEETLNKTAKEETKVKKVKKEKKENSKKINIRIAPGNWTRLEKYVTDFNDNPDRSTGKLKYTNVINEAVSEFLTKEKNV